MIKAGVQRSEVLPAFQVAIQVQTLNGLHIDRFVGYKLFNREKCKECESLHGTE
jgi:hypothetical protein